MARRRGLGRGAERNRVLPADGDGVWFPDEFGAFHWHGDTFGIPEGALGLASSAATRNQALVCNDNVLGLQFHLETTEESLRSLSENCAAEISAAPFIQPLGKMRPFFPTLWKANELMAGLLGRLFCD